ncbi:chromate efflux transporter [Geovibrio thiophilus]|uniref:Chromate efflux transporter n=1 Tax=Geovibrio thiophilus TaxID=139438 RepID=A0A410JXG8_9BACT|nr:chromate efflux transporter [Geovibrio thiophilus]QAR32731.1 chromate efflux transporter [Geovibrio thiophilus]
MGGMKNIMGVFTVFLRLGLTSFGGPVAHLGYFRDEFVVRRKWMNEQEYADLVALCQFLPGPASSQVGFAVGLKRAGKAGGLAAWLGFTIPSALIMIAFAYGVASFSGALDSGWLKGLKVAAVAVVAHAVWGMAVKLCPDRLRAVIAVISACAVLAFSSGIMQIGVIIAGGGAGYFLIVRQQGEAVAQKRFSVRSGAFYLILFLAFLILLPFAAAYTDLHAVRLADSFYRAGSLVFGGGHVVLPLIQAEVTAGGWLGRDEFMAGYGAVQAVPGPLFTFAAYLGAASHAAPNGFAGGMIALVFIFLPSMLLVMGVLPFWEKLRSLPAAQSVLAGTNAAVVGLLLAAFYDPVFTEGIKGRAEVITALCAFGLLQFMKTPSWVVVVLSAAAGFVLL